MRFMQVLKIMLTFAGIIAVVCCTECSQKIAGSEVTNEKNQATLYLPGGKQPAQGAHILIVPADYVPPKVGLDKQANTNATIIRTTTDNDGHYSLQGITGNNETGNNFYNVLADLDSLGLLRDSIQLPLTSEAGLKDTLKNSSSLSGIVKIQPNSDVSTIVVQAVGTNVFVNVNAQGKFTIPKLAMGDYRLKISTYLQDYVPAYVPVVVFKQTPDTIKDTIRLHYSGIPVITGIQASYDSLTGMVHVHWNATDFMDLSDYIIYKDPFDSIQPSTKPIAATQDTFYNDNIIPSNFDAGSYRYKYRVAARNNSFTAGLTYKYVPVTMVSKGKLSLKINQKNTGYFLTRSPKLSVEIKSPTTMIKSIQWRQVLPFDSIIKSTTFSLPLHTAKDTASLDFTKLDTAFTKVICTVKDFFAATATDSLEFSIFDTTRSDTIFPVQNSSQIFLKTRIPYNPGSITIDSLVTIRVDFYDSLAFPLNLAWKIYDTDTMYTITSNFKNAYGTDSIAHSWHSTGIKRVVCTLSDSAGNSKSDTLNINVVSLPSGTAGSYMQKVNSFSQMNTLQNTVWRKKEYLI